MASTALLIGFVIMSLGSLALYVTGSKDPAVRHHTQFHSLVPFIAATSYLAMYLGTFVLTRSDNVPIYVPRYIDWTFTTPILLAGLSMVALHEHGRKSGFITAIIGVDVLMIAAGLLSALSTDPTTRLVWFLWSCAAFLGVLYMLWGPLREQSAAYGGKLDAVYKGNAAYLTVVWLLYPIVFAIGPEGLGMISSPASVWAILVLDVVAKVVYGYVSSERIKSALPELSGRDQTSPDFARRGWAIA